MTGAAPLVVSAALLLAACAATPEPVPVVAAPGGEWEVTDAMPAGAADRALDPRGQRLRLDPALAGDPAGRLCPQPVYTAEDGTLAGLAGVDLVERVTDRPLPVLVVTCDGQPFARFGRLPDGSLLGSQRGWLVRLEPAGARPPRPAPVAPAPVTPPEPPPPPPPAPPPVVSAPPPVLVYLASYRTEALARRGWAGLGKRTKALSGHDPVLRPIDLKGRGHFIRLYAPVADDDAAKALCAGLRSVLSDCGAAWGRTS